jgi:GTP-binding protein
VKISTSQLNKFFTEVIKQTPSPVWQTKDVKFYYLTQTQQSPPSFIAFANHPEGVTPAYRRFLIRKIQENWSLQGIPIRIFVLPKGGAGRDRGAEA